MIESGDRVGITRASSKPALAKRARNSASERSRPPGIISISRSMSFPRSGCVARLKHRLEQDAPGRSAFLQLARMFRRIVRRPRVVPVVDDVLHDVGVAVGDLLEEVPGLAWHSGPRRPRRR